MLRYIFIPLIQFESPKFQQMVRALFDGMSQFLPNMSYDVQMFLAKRVLGVPGYQYDVDMTKESVCRPVFTDMELKEIRQYISREPGYEYADEMMFGNGIPLVEIRQTTVELMDSTLNSPWTKLAEHGVDVKGMSGWYKFMGLDDPKQLVVTILRPDDGGWTKHLNDKKFYVLTGGDQFGVRLGCWFAKWLNYKVGRLFLESVLSMILYFMRKWHMAKMQVPIEWRR